MEALLELHDCSKKDADALSCSRSCRFRLRGAVSADGYGCGCTTAAASSLADVSDVFTCGVSAGAAPGRSAMAGDALKAETVPGGFGGMLCVEAEEEGMDGEVVKEGTLWAMAAAFGEGMVLVMDVNLAGVIWSFHMGG